MLLMGVTTFFYSMAFVMQWQFLVKKTSIHKSLGILATFIALSLHAYLLYRWVDIAGGQNLTFFTLLSLLIWLICVLIEFLSFKQPMAHLLLFAIPIAIASIGLVSYFPGQNIVYTRAHLQDVVHIIMAIFVFAIFCVAALQAVSLAWMHHRLRSSPSSGMMQIQSFPPLESMEKSMFLMMFIGFILLSALIGISFYFFADVMFNQLWQKTLLTFAAWVIFAFILLGRYGFGWRGRKAVYGTLSGVTILMIVYFCSQLFMEILH